MPPAQDYSDCISSCGGSLNPMAIILAVLIIGLFFFYIHAQEGNKK